MQSLTTFNDIIEITGAEEVAGKMVGTCPVCGAEKSLRIDSAVGREATIWLLCVTNGCSWKQIFFEVRVLKRKAELKRELEGAR